MNKKILVSICLTVFLLSLVSLIPLNNAQVVGSGSINSGLVGYWRFNNNILDSSGNGFYGSVVGAIYTTGIFDKSLNFSNPLSINNNIVTIPSNNQFQQIGNVSFGYSFNVWVYPLTQAQGDRIIETEGTDYPITLILNGANELYFNIFNGSVQTQVMCHINSNVWSMVTCLRDIATHKFLIYVNGVLNASGTDLTPDSSVISSDSFRFGQTTANNRGFNGLIDEVRFYNRTLSSSEISNLYNGYPITISNDLGSTVSPVGVVYVGVDQSLLISVGALPNYISWSQYFDGQIVSPSSTYLLNNVESNHTFYVTSQYIGNGNSQVTQITNNFDYNYIIFIALFLVNITLCIKRIPILGLPLGFFTIILSGLVFMNDLNITKYFTYLLIVVGFSCMVINGLDVRRKK